MNVALAPFIVEGVLIIVCAVFGILLGRVGRPYGKIKLVIHLFFFVWLTIGFVFIFAGVAKETSPLLIPVTLMGLAILTQLFAGIKMLASKEAGKTIPTIHKVSAIVMLLSDICALIITALR
jgi:hypothetical protein